MSYVAVGDDGLVLRLSTEGALHREFTSNLNVNGVARAPVNPWGQSERYIAVCDEEVTYWQHDGHWERSGVSDEPAVSNLDPIAVARPISNLNAIAFAPRTSIGFTVGDDGFFGLTFNAEGWKHVYRVTHRDLRAVCAVDMRTVWVAGDEGDIWRSSNVMATPVLSNGALMKWTPMNTGVTKNLRGIAVGHRMVIAVGDDGTVVYHRNGKWGHTQITGKNLRALAMSPGGKVIAVGDDGWIGIRKLAGTGSEASQWTEYTNVTSKHLRGVVAHNDNYWAIVGDAAFLTSNDGGGHWHQHENDGTLNAVC
jgi:hypothetical protein